MSKEQLINVIKKNFEFTKKERAKLKYNYALNVSRLALQKYQVEKLKKNHSELFVNVHTKEAANFFLNEIYTPHHVGAKDKDIEKLLPLMDKVFPISALEVVCKAIVLEALTEKLDSKLALELGNDFTDEQYKVAYTTVTTREEREVQLDLLESLGLSICKLVKAPLIHTTLKLMKGPAKLADLTDIHNFLEKGFYTFKNMKNGEDFIKQLIHKERQVLEKYFN